MTAFLPRVRYGRTFWNRKPKICLITQRIGDFVYFGISRCNPTDVFRKTEARRIASDRLEDEKSRLPVSDVDFLVTAGGMSGYASVSAVNLIYEYFYRVDPVVEESWMTSRSLRQFSHSLDASSPNCDCGSCNSAWE